MQCQICKGKGWNGPVHVNRGDQGGGWVDRMDCRECSGTGEWTQKRYLAWRQGREHRRARIVRKESLMQCAINLGCTPAQLSAYERGSAPLPARSE